MAIIHRTTLTPTKLELLTSWLPGRPWYAGEATVPRLTKSGGFRLDDPDGEVGLEFMAVTDESADEPVTYHMPLTYRDAPLAGGDGEAQAGAVCETLRRFQHPMRWRPSTIRHRGSLASLDVGCFRFP